ncbi:MAG: hypothetical protein IJ202_13695 [Bacteroidales bacterium]|nr:hypothetical protein [Bacteroidales bacterium]
MTPLRICEESEARLMIREGSFTQYFEKWSGLFPQRTRLSRIRELHSKCGMGLSDALNFTKATETEDDEVRFTVGEKVLIRKKNGKKEVYRKKGDFWIIRKEGLRAFDSEDIFTDSPLLDIIPICKESEIFHVKSSSSLAKKAIGILRRKQWTKGALFSFGEHELWEIDGFLTIRIHSRHPQTQTINFTVEDLAKHIELYRCSHKREFSEF